MTDAELQALRDMPIYSANGHGVLRNGHPSSIVLASLKARRLIRTIDLGGAQERWALTPEGMRELERNAKRPESFDSGL